MAARTVGIIVLILGIVLLAFGINASDSPVDRISEALTGEFTDGTMLYLILGIVGIVAGLVMMTRGHT